ncbi:MAG: hypothetical protein RLZZ414_1572 [Bacteroidota bacterium]
MFPITILVIIYLFYQKLGVLFYIYLQSVIIQYVKKPKFMIQRLQSIHYLIAGIFQLLFSFSVLFTINPSANPTEILYFTAKGIQNQNFELLVSDYKNFILCIFNAVLIFIVIFLFKKQALQLKLTRLFILIVIVEAFFIFLSYQNISAQGNVNIGWEIIYLPISLVFSLAAYRKVKKDWELLKSVDRIR